MLFLADAGDLIGGLVTILIILVTVGSAIRQALQQKKAGEKGGGAGRLSQERGGGRGTPSDDIQKFLAELTKQTSGGGPSRSPARQTPQQRERQPAQRAPRARPVPTGYGQQRAAPAQPPQKQAQPRRQPQEVTVRRARQRTPRKLTAEQVRAQRERRLRKEAAAAHAAKEAAEGKRRKRRKRTLTGAEKTAEQIRTSIANRLETLLPDDPLQRAIVLRDVLGPCRARDRYRPGRW